MSGTENPKTPYKLTLTGMGKMGQMIASLAPEYGFEIWMTIDAGQESLLDDPRFAESDVMIDFSISQVAYSLCRKAIEKGVPVVSGTTGWNDQLKQLQDEIESRHRGTLFYASNFSIGMNLFFVLNKQLSRLIAPHKDYLPEMKEKHHLAKKDAPSGTAITLVEDLLTENSPWTTWHIEGDLPDGTLVKSPKKSDSLGYSIPIEVAREGEHTGLHSVSYRSKIDTITITHESFSREGFARGALWAAQYTLHHEGVLGMEQLLSDISTSQN